MVLDFKLFHAVTSPFLKYLHKFVQSQPIIVLVGRVWKPYHQHYFPFPATGCSVSRTSAKQLHVVVF